MTNRLELVQYLLDQIESTERLMDRVDACYPAGPIRDIKLAELKTRVAADRQTLSIITDNIVASV